MKKIIMMLVCCVVLSGCSNKEESTKEYTVDEFSEIYWEICEYDSQQFSKLTESEKWGDSETDKEKTEFANPIHAKFQKEKMDEYEISYSKPITIRGKVGNLMGNDCIELKSLENNYDILPIVVRMVDSLDDLKEGNVVVIEAEFLEELAGKFPIMGNGKIVSK